MISLRVAAAEYALKGYLSDHPTPRLALVDILTDLQLWAESKGLVFMAALGAASQVAGSLRCEKCGEVADGNFCKQCGHPF